MNDWQPDLETLEWGLASIYEPGIGDAIIEQLVQRIPAIASIDRALLGEAAVEAVLYTLIANRDNPRGKPVFDDTVTDTKAP